MTFATLDLFPDREPLAEFSPCETWRYVLRRRWSAGDAIGFILLNPSTADETNDDPTIRRCIDFAKRWGYAGLVLGNLFALRSTDPTALRRHTDPIGPDNNAALKRICEETRGRIICGWGIHGGYMARGTQVLGMLRQWGAEPFALSKTHGGDPGHPLYLPASSQPIRIETAPKITVETVMKALGKFRFRLDDEKRLQSEIATALDKEMIPYQREYRLSKEDIIDFLIGGSIGLEVKIKGGKRDIFRQCERYCRHDAVSALILATNSAMGLPETIDGKPTSIVSLGTSWLASC